MDASGTRLTQAASRASTSRRANVRAPRAGCVTRTTCARFMLYSAAQQEVAHDVPEDLRVLAQATRAVGTPLGAERHVDAHAVPGRAPLLPQRLAHAEQHLELVAFRLDTLLAAQGDQALGQVLVVGGEGEARASRQQEARGFHVGLADRPGLGVRDR